MVKAEKLDAPKELNFIKNGKLNMVVVRQPNKEVVKIDTSTQQFLTNPLILRADQMDQILFQPTAVFKVTLDFRKVLPCVEGTAVRESTDWVLCSCMGQMASFNKVDEVLVLSQCVVTVQSNVDPLVMPFQCVLKFEEDEWVVVRVSR
jgi:hypothetical protein